MAKQIASSNSKPGAWIVSPKDRGRKSIKNGKVFLNDEDEFEIELFNTLTVSVLADIKLNGQSISKTGLVVKPGQRVFLDCFIDDRKKFKFSTYEIDGGLESLEATQNNGLLEVFFYKEDVITLNNWQRRFDKIIVEKHYPYNPYPWYNPNTIYCGTNTTIGTVYGDNSTGYNLNGLKTKTSTYAAKSNFDLTNLNVDGSLSSNSIPVNSVETGRVERGEESKQKFTEVDMEFENNFISSTIIQILPESRKPAEVKSSKINCSCGSEIKETFKFCPECGVILKRTKTEIVYIEGSSYEYNNKNYLLGTFNLSLVDLLERNKNKLIVINKLSLSENSLRAVIID